MKYVFGIIKRFNYTKTENHTRKGRKHYFCYEFDMESGQFRRVRISTFKAIYYKITFIFGLKAKRITRIYCEDCRKHHDSFVNFWDNDISCPYC